MQKFELKITKRAVKDIRLFSAKEKQKAVKILQNVILKNPYEGKKLVTIQSQI